MIGPALVGIAFLVLKRLAVALVATLGSVALLGPGASAEPRASVRVIDRTMICATQVRGGIRVLVAQAVAGIKESSRPLVWKQLPSITVSTGFERWLASASAGAYPAPRGGWFAVSSTLCRTATENVALSTNGLTPELVGQGGSQRRCLQPPRQVLVRVRATFRRPTSLTRDAQYRQWRTTVPVRTAEIAARTLTGKPLAYARVFDDGRARLFAAPTCYPD